MPGTLSTFVGTRNSIKSCIFQPSHFFGRGHVPNVINVTPFLGGKKPPFYSFGVHLRKTVFPTRPSQGVQRLGTTWTKNETQERSTKKVRKDRPVDPSTRPEGAWVMEVHSASSSAFGQVAGCLLPAKKHVGGKKF